MTAAWCGLLSTRETPSCSKGWRRRCQRCGEHKRCEIVSYFAGPAFFDTKAWQVKRRERTRQLIELGELVAKAGFIELANDNRAVIFGALLDAAVLLTGEQREVQMALWRRPGKGAFDGT